MLIQAIKNIFGNFTPVRYTEPNTSCKPRKKKIVMDDIKIESANDNLKALDFRPKKFADIIGQDDVKEYLKIKIASFKKTNLSVGHMLFLGYSGSGKTTLANVMAKEMGVGFHSVMGTRLKSWEDFYNILKKINTNDVIFIDEIHALSKEIQENLYSVMEDFVVNLEDNGLKAQIQTRIPRFTLIGATTHSGDLNPPLLSRFQYKGQLRPYSIEQLTEMVVSAGNRIYKVRVPYDVARYIAKVSRKTARICYNLLHAYIVVVEAEYAGRIESHMLTKDLLYKTLKLEQLDPVIGLDYASRKYIVTMLRENGKPIGSKSLATMIREQESTVTQMIEPFLLSDIELEFMDASGNAKVQVGPFAKLTKNGRIATRESMNYPKLCKALQTQGWFTDESFNY
jgi:Holliday junction DNA helicase RuvB